MQAVVEAAVISGCFGILGIGGTVMVALAGFRANRRISSESAQAERDRRLWEKRCAAYEEIIEILDDRQAHRAQILAIAQAAKAGAPKPEQFSSIPTKYLADFHDPATRGPRSRLLAYASAEVRTAFYQMIADDMAAGFTLVTWGTHLFAQQKNLPMPDPKDSWSKYEELQKLVIKRDKELTDLIRRELGSDPPPEPTPQIWHGLMSTPNGEIRGSSCKPDAAKPGETGQTAAT